MALTELFEAEHPYHLIRRAQALPISSADRATLLDRAIVLADQLGDDRVRFDAREQRLWPAVFRGEDVIAFALFAWCQRMVDDRPDIVESSAMLWHYKLMLAMLPQFARPSEAQIEGVAREMQQRYEAHGQSLRPVFAKRGEAAAFMGRIEAARSLWDQAQLLPRDKYADCRACELDFEVWLLLKEGRHTEAIAAANRILNNNHHCGEVPHKTYPMLMEALWNSGKRQEAGSLSVKAYGMIHDNPNFIQEVARLIEFHVATGDLERASELAIRHREWLRDSTSDLDHFHFLRALHGVIQAEGRTNQLSVSQFKGLSEALCALLRLPSERTDAGADWTCLAECTASAGERRARDLDARNGNAYYQHAWRTSAFPRPPKE